MNKTAVIISVAIPIPTFAFCVAPQQSKKVLRKRILGSCPLFAPSARIEAFGRGLRELGFWIGIKQKEYSYG